MRKHYVNGKVCNENENIPNMQSLTICLNRFCNIKMFQRLNGYTYIKFEYILNHENNFY